MGWRATGTARWLAVSRHTAESSRTGSGDIEEMTDRTSIATRGAMVIGMLMLTVYVTCTGIWKRAKR
jgi:hypothetical protein